MSSLILEEITQVKSLFPLASGETEIMTMASAYLFNIPGNPTIQISKDELRSLLREIESELHRSKVYRLAVANVQKILGSSHEQATNVLKAIGREAITLAFKQFAHKQESATNIPLPEDDTEILSHTSLEDSNHLQMSETKLTPNLHPELVDSNPNEPISISSPTLNEQADKKENIQTDVKSNIIVEGLAKPKTAIQWLWQNHKLSKRERIAKLAAEERLESLRQIGEQLRQARESQSLTLQKLNIYTHISVHLMEAVENANFDLLPEDILIRGFIRVMGNALGLNGTILANSLATPNQSKSVLPSWYQNNNSSEKLNLEIRPIHLYVGYTALVAGAVGGLSFISHQPSNHALQKSQVLIPTSSSLCESNQQTEANIKPEMNTHSVETCLGASISPPEAL